MLGRSSSFCVAALLTLLAGCRGAASDPAGLGTAEVLARGVQLYRTGDPSLVAHAGPIAVWLVRVDPELAAVSSVLSNDEVLEAETVEEMAGRHGAVAAINGGFFNRDTGEPTGVLKVGGEFVSDSSVPRGAVVITPLPVGSTHLLFDRLAAKVTMTFTAGSQTWQVPIDGVDTTRGRSKVMLYTPAYHADTDTASTGTEWVLEGTPLRVAEIRRNAGKSRIPAGGAVLSFGGSALPPMLAALVEGTTVVFHTVWRSRFGLPDTVFDSAPDIVNGAGLLRREGQAVHEWQAEGLSDEAFTGARHPRSVVGVDRRGFIWLIAVDGRRPDYSIGMTFADLERLCARLDLTGALNLDGGGSTTLVAKGHVVNRPSDPGGPRPVSDAIVVTAR